MTQLGFSNPWVLKHLDLTSDTVSLGNPKSDLQLGKVLKRPTLSRVSLSSERKT